MSLDNVDTLSVAIFLSQCFSHEDRGGEDDSGEEEGKVLVSFFY